MEMDVLTLMRDAMMTAAVISLPLLGAALLAGVIVGLLQALTSIQEMTLTFVPKLAFMLLVFMLSVAYMARELLQLFDRIVIPAFG